MAYSDVVLADSPFAYWKLGETSGTTAVDEVGTRDGTYSGPTLGAASIVVNNGGDPSASFDGTNDLVTVPHDTVFDISGDFTVELWLWPTASTLIHRGIIGNGNSGNTFGWWLTQLDDFVDHVGFGNYIGGGGGQFHSSAPLKINSCNHVVATSTASGRSIFLNNVETTSFAYTPHDTGVHDLYIGYNDTHGGFFKGRIDEVALYSYALTASQVQSHFNFGNCEGGPGWGWSPGGARWARF